MNLIADNLSRLRTGEHYNHDFPLENREPIILKEKNKVNMVTTHAQATVQGTTKQKLPELQVKVRDIFKTSDK